MVTSCSLANRTLGWHGEWAALSGTAWRFVCCDFVFSYFYGYFYAPASADGSAPGRCNPR